MTDSPARGIGRFRHVTLRGRLVAVLLACLLVSCVVVAAATSFALRRFLVDRLDQQLAAAGTRYVVSLEHPGDGDADDRDFRQVVGQAGGTLGARAIGGTVTAMDVVGAPPEKARGSAAARAALGRLAVTRGPCAYPTSASTASWSPRARTATC